MPTAPTVPFQPLPKTTQALLQFCHQTVNSNFNFVSMRNRFEYIDREFYRTNLSTDDAVKGRTAAMQGKKIHLRDIVMPILEPQIETSLAFLTSVFLTGEPIFSFVAPPNLIQYKKQYDAIMSENQTRGGWAAQLMMFMRDGLKYNFCALEVDWCTETIYSAAQKVTPGKQNSVEAKETLWAGNKLTRRDPYNVIYDIRVPIDRQHKDGEFSGYIELMSRIKLKQFIQNLPYKINITDAFNSQFGGGSTTSTAGNGGNYYIPSINDLAIYDRNKLQGAMNWDAWAQLAAPDKDKRINYKGLYEVTTRYIRIIPREFGMAVPRPGQPQIWKVITVNDQVVIYVERMTNAHDYLPIIFGQFYNDGLGFQSRGTGEKLIPIQDLASAAWNARLATQRRKVSDRALYDPSRIKPDDVNSENAAAKIPVKPNAYGKPVGDAYHAIPFEDRESGTFVQDGKDFQTFGNSITGQNPAQQGQFVKGNKTQAEYEDVQNHASGRQRTQAIFIENQVFVPVKEIIKLNILQYQPDGPVTNPITGETVDVNMEDLRTKALAFQVSDGLTPTDKLIDADSWSVAIQTLGSSQELQQEFDMGAAFTYLMQLRNVDLSPFRRTQPQQVQDAVNKNKLDAHAAGAAEGAKTAAVIAATPQPTLPQTPVLPVK
jgi:hypothetical protein